MENMWAVFMHGDTINILAIYIASKMRALIYNKTTFPMHLGLLREYRIE